MSYSLRSVSACVIQPEGRCLCASYSKKGRALTRSGYQVLLLVTPSFAACDWTCGFTVQQAQRNITDTLPDRVLVVFLEEPRNLPPMASLELLLRNYPEKNVFHVPRNAPTHHSAWERLAKAILGEENK